MKDWVGRVCSNTVDCRCYFGICIQDDMQFWYDFYETLQDVTNLLCFGVGGGIKDSTTSNSEYCGQEAREDVLTDISMLMYEN